MRAPLIVPLIAASMTAAAAAPLPHSPAGSQTFAGWTATCNNVGACVVIATSAEAMFYLRIAREAGAYAAPSVKIVLATPEPFTGSDRAFRLTAERGTTATVFGPFPATTTVQDVATAVGHVPAGEPSLRLIETLGVARTLAYKIGPMQGTLALEGLADALRFTDVQQGRAGTQTALIAGGPLPPTRVPEPPPVPTIKAAPSGSVSVVTRPAVPKDVAAMAAPVCDPEVVKAQEGAQEWKLRADLMLLAVPCVAGATNSQVALYTTDAGGHDARPVLLQQPPGTSDDRGQNVVANMRLEPKTLTLTGFEYGRGLGDCGATRTWVWTGQIFALLDATELQACPGSLPKDWPNTFTARRAR